jgi:hypothetical protein
VGISGRHEPGFVDESERAAEDRRYAIGGETLDLGPRVAESDVPMLGIKPAKSSDFDNVGVEVAADFARRTEGEQEIGPSVSDDIGQDRSGAGLALGLVRPPDDQRFARDR